MTLAEAADLVRESERYEWDGEDWSELNNLTVVKFGWAVEQDSWWSLWDGLDDNIDDLIAEAPDLDSLYAAIDRRHAERCLASVRVERDLR
jgi:hypothetical protein